MMTNTGLGNILKVGFIAVIISFIGYVSYDKPEIFGSKKEKPAKQPAAGQFAQPANILKDSIVDFGMELLGTPYVAAGCSTDGFDCSGFVHFVFRHFKIEVPRSSAQFEHFGTEIAIEDVQKGDLLLFLSPTRNAIGHIGIVSDAKGKNSDFIHASSGREMKVIITNLANEGYTRRFVKAVRVL